MYPLRRRRVFSTVALGAVLTLASLSLALPLIGPVFPPLYGGTASCGAPAGDAGGNNLQVCAGTLPGYSALYWGLANSTAAAISLHGSPTAADVLAYVGVSDGVATWQGTSFYHDPTTNFSGTVSTRLLLGAPNVQVVPALSAIGAVVNVLTAVSGNCFTVSLQAQAFYNGAWRPINALQQSASNLTQFFFSDAFYYTLACTSCRGDVTGEHQLNGDDVQCFLECLLFGGSSTHCPTCVCADMNNDGAVDALDLPQFVSALLSPPPC